MTQPVADPGFVADLKHALSVWKGSLLVPGFYLLMALASAIYVVRMPKPPTDCLQKTFGECPLTPEQTRSTLAVGLLMLPLSIFYVGMSGTARLWYMRRFNGDDLTGRQVWSCTWRYWGRFFVLALLALAVASPGIIAAIVLLARDDKLGFSLAVAATTALIDVLFTFVTPGLALYNPSVTKAFRGGLSILRSTWPHCALYALVPPLGLTLIARFAANALPDGLTVALALIGPPLTLLFTGATTAFLLRRFPPMGEAGSLGYLPGPIPSFRAY
jgi:hypothetical protein